MNSPELLKDASKPIVVAKNVTKKVETQEGKLIILHPISLSIANGESIAITGASGSGKSTLLGILAGLDVPTSGEVIIQDQIITQMDEEGRAKVRADHVGFIFQSFQLLPGLTALENVMLPLELRGDKFAKKKSENFLARVGLAQRFHHYPQQLSGGEQQRVAIARAFACESKILFADEPTGNLDSVTGERIIDLLFDLNRSQATTLILITHEERLAKRCDRRVELAAGVLVESELGNEVVTNAEVVH